MKKLVLSLAIVAIVPAITGCRIRAHGYIAPPPPVRVEARIGAPPPPAVQIQVAAPTVSAGVQVVEASCTQGAAEQCDGLDNNCNGQIDEGCGYASGAIQITSAWNTGADIDLYVTDPSGETISYSHTNSGSGGVLDQDARGNCRSDQANNRVENVFWNTPTPPRGDYRVELHYWGDCNSGAGPTTSVLSIAVGGRVIGAYSYTLTRGQRATVATFNIP